MAGGQRRFRVGGWMPWILTAILMVWSGCGNGQGQGNWKHLTVE